MSKMKDCEGAESEDNAAEGLPLFEGTLTIRRDEANVDD